MARTGGTRTFGNDPQTIWGLKPVAVTYENAPRAWIANGNAAVLSTGVPRATAINLPSGAVVTNIHFWSLTTALTRGSDSGTSHVNVGLYSSASVLLRQSTDDTTTAWAASTLKTWPLSSAFTTTYSGLYYLVLCVAVGTGGSPAVPSLNAISINSTVAASAPILSGNSADSSITTTLPDPLGAITGNTNMMWAGVS